MSLGWGHVLAQTTDGKLFGWGYSADGRLGRLGDTVKPSPLDSSGELPGKREMTPSEALDVAEKLVLESMEKEKDMPIVWEPHVIEETESIGVTDVSCGLDHSLLICRKPKSHNLVLHCFLFFGSSLLLLIILSQLLSLDP